jgi:hypothetical protein
MLDSQLRNIKNKLKILSKSDPLKPIAQAILSGHSWAPPGERHDPILSITMLLAQKDAALSDELLSALFAPSLSAMNNATQLNKEILNAYRGAVGMIKKGLTSRNEKQNTYTPEELAFIAKKQNCTVEELQNKWIIQSGGGGWVLKKDGNYTPLKDAKDINVVIRKYLKNAPVDLVKINPTTGATSYKSLTEIVYEYGDVSFRNIVKMNAQNSYFDSDTKTMIESVCPIRPLLKPVYDAQIDLFLQKFFGDNYAKGLDWLCGCTMLDEIICAIYFNAPRGSGKNLIVYGVSAIWTDEGPSDLSLVFSDFNETLLKGPVIFADEEIEKKNRWESVTPKLRSMLSTTTRTLTRKHKSPSVIHGGIRLFLAGNSDSLLDSNEIHTSADIDAIAERVWYHEIKNNDAADYLNTIDLKVKRRWGLQGIAEHVLWLKENHVIQNPGSRFIVEGSSTEMHQLLRTGTPFNSFVCEWLIKWLENPSHFVGTPYDDFVRIYKKQLLVNNRVIVDNWDHFIKNKRYEPTTKIIGTALRSLAEKDTIPVNCKGKTVRYHVILPESLVAWANRYTVGDPELIMNRINEIAVIDKPLPLANENQGSVFDAIDNESKGY